MSTLVIPPSAETTVQVVAKGPYSQAAKAAAAAKISGPIHSPRLPATPGTTTAPMRMPPRAVPTPSTVPLSVPAPAHAGGPSIIPAPMSSTPGNHGNDALRRELEAKQRELESAVAESSRMRARHDEVLAQADQFRAERERLRVTGEAHQAELKKLREDLALTTSERDSLRGRVLAPAFGTGSEEIERAKADLATLEREREEYKAKLSALPPLREQLSSLTAERAKLLVAVSEGKRDADALRAEIAGLQARLHHAEAREKDHARQMMEIGREQNDLKTRLASTETVTKELAAARAETLQVRSQFGELTRAFEAARHDRDEISAVASERASLLDQAKVALETARAELTSLRESSAAVTSERERIKASADESAEEVHELQQRVDSLLDDLHAREREVAESKPVLKEARERGESLEKELAEAKSRLGEMEARIADKEKEAVESAAVREKFSLLEAERTRLQEQLTRANAELGGAQEQLRNLRTEKEQARSTVNELQSQMERNFDHVHALEAERDTLRSDLEAVKTGLERAKQHVSVLQARRDVLREEINKLRARLGLPPEG